MAYQTRTADWVITKAYLHSNRKATPPSSGTAKYNALLAIVDSVQKQWEDEPDVEWSSLYELVTLTPVVTATDTFALHDDINYLSRREGEYVQVTDGTQTKNYKIVSPNQLYATRYEDTVAQIGRNLKFSREFAADSSLLGYSIKVPSITYTTDIETGTDILQIEDPLWAAYMTAYEFVRNDIVKRNTKDDLLDLANQRMMKMKQKNGGGYEVIPRTFFVNAGEDL